MRYSWVPTPQPLARALGLAAEQQGQQLMPEADAQQLVATLM
jgi:hypothetical protein